MFSLSGEDAHVAEREFLIFATGMPEARPFLSRV